MSGVALMWFRKDLRLADNEALAAALGAAETVACVAAGRVAEPGGSDSGESGPAASARWRAASLASLDSDLRSRGGALAVLDALPEAGLPALAARLGAEAVFCSRDHTPEGEAEERRVAAALRPAGVELVTLPGQLLVPPGELQTASGQAYRVFTPFFRTWLAMLRPEQPLPAPERVPAPAGFAGRHPALSHPGHGLEPPTPDREAWEAGERAAGRRLVRFADAAVASYADLHDRPDCDGTSELSPRLACGEVSPRQVVSAIVGDTVDERTLPFVRQLVWREFAYHVLAAFPSLASQPWRPEFSAMPWREDAHGLAAWAEGRTGYPLVDAGMRQLASTGWMHNRVRMVAASFLTKDLLVPWQAGERVFRRLLADFDPAANAFNWQWVAGSGADASPYFRVFNPVVQGEKFDPEGTYVRRWVPELAGLPARWIHRPWTAPESELATAGVSLGADYPRPVVEHSEARQRALAAFAEVRSASTHHSADT